MNDLFNSSLTRSQLAAMYTRLYTDIYGHAPAIDPSAGRAHLVAQIERLETLTA